MTASLQSSGPSQSVLCVIDSPGTMARALISARMPSCAFGYDLRGFTDVRQGIGESLRYLSIEGRHGNQAT